MVFNFRSSFHFLLILRYFTHSTSLRHGVGKEEDHLSRSWVVTDQHCGWKCPWSNGITCLVAGVLNYVHPCSICLANGPFQCFCQREGEPIACQTCIGKSQLATNADKNFKLGKGFNNDKTDYKQFAKKVSN